MQEPARSLIHIHCSVFSDLTLVGITVPHILCDAKGMGEIMQAWSSVVNRGIDSVEDLPIDYNPWKDLKVIKQEPQPAPRWSLLSSLLTKWRSWAPVFRQRWEMFWYPKESNRIIHFPTSELEHLRTECRKELGPDAKLFHQRRPRCVVIEDELFDIFSI